MKSLAPKMALMSLLGAGCEAAPSPRVDAARDEEAPPDLGIAATASFTEIRERILVPTCAAGASCHSLSGSATSGLDLATDPYRALVGVAAVNAEAAGQGLLRVKPCDPDASFLWIKLDLFNPRYQGHRYGSPMPLDRPPLADAEKQAIRDWIARGAPIEDMPDAAGSTCYLDGAAVD